MRLFLILCLLSVSLPGQAEQFIAVQASGWVESVPDTLSLDFTVQSTGKDVEALQRRVDGVVQQAVAAAREAGVKKDDIDSAGVTVRPEFEWRDGQRIYQGQTVQRDVNLVLRELDRYGALLQALARLDITRMGSPRLTHSDQTELELRALEQALANGTTKARRIAGAIDAELGEVLRVEEQGTHMAQPMGRMMAAEAAPGGAPQVQFGKQRINATVNMRFAIGRGE